MRKQIAVLSCLLLLSAAIPNASGYVTSDGSGTHIFPGEMPAFFPGAFTSGLDHVGVTEIFLSKIGSPSFTRCSGALLPSRAHILTAAHCFTDSTGAFDVEVPDSKVTFHDSMFGFPFEIDIAVEDFVIHPGFDGALEHGFDFGIITLELDSDLSMDIPDYKFASGPFIDPDTGFGFEVGVPTVKAGFGSTGFGMTGAVSGSGGDKRLGLNTYEFIDLTPVTGILAPETQIIYDFDSGDAANDGGEVHFMLPPDVGYGDDEIGASTGDSGGPTFIQDAMGDYVIVGTTSYGLKFIETDGTTSDVDTVINESWGEFIVDGRVASVSGWIESVIPEPNAGAMLLAAAMMMLGNVRRHRESSATAAGPK